MVSSGGTGGGGFIHFLPLSHQKYSFEVMSLFQVMSHLASPTNSSSMALVCLKRSYDGPKSPSTPAHKYWCWKSCNRV